jgi:hypothetical protein
MQSIKTKQEQMIEEGLVYFYGGEVTLAQRTTRYINFTTKDVKTLMFTSSFEASNACVFTIRENSVYTPGTPLVAFNRDLNILTFEDSPIDNASVTTTVSDVGNRVIFSKTITDRYQLSELLILRPNTSYTIEIENDSGLSSVEASFSANVAKVPDSTAMKAY